MRGSYFILLSFFVFFLIIVGISSYVQSLYYNSLAKDVIRKIVMLQLVIHNKEQIYIPFEVNVRNKNQAFQKIKNETFSIDEIVKDKDISVICKVSSTVNSFVIVAKHKYGDKIYGIDSDNFRLKYKDSSRDYRLKYNDCPNPKDNKDDLKGWIYVGKLEIHKILFDY